MPKRALLMLRKQIEQLLDRFLNSNRIEDLTR